MKCNETCGYALVGLLIASWLFPYSETNGSEGSVAEPRAGATANNSFQPVELQVPEGFHVELAAGPPLVTHPTMACFDDQGGLYVCNNAGVNMSNEELEANLPNAIHRLVDEDGDACVVGGVTLCADADAWEITDEDLLACQVDTDE